MANSANAARFSILYKLKIFSLFKKKLKLKYTKKINDLSVN